MVKAAIRLNLGSRNRAIPGFTGIDIDAHAGVDIVGDISDLSRFETGSVSEIYASHCLEHFPHPKTEGVLREWARVLEPGGILHVAVPDFARAVELYQKFGVSQWLMDYVSGGQEYATAYHYRIFDFKSLSDILSKVGFREISHIGDMPYGLEDCSSMKSNYDGKSVSLNVMAVH